MSHLHSIVAGGVALALGVCSLGAAPPVAAQEEEQRTLDVGGLVFGDVYHVADHHTAAGEEATGLVVRRAYLTLDADGGQRFYGRVRLELNQAGEFETYTYDLRFKDLYLGLRSGGHRVVFGKSPTVTYDLIESLWGMRYLMRTPLDLQGVASRDIGVAASGRLNATGTFLYRAMFGTGIEFGAESGDGRKWMGAVTWQPSPLWTVDLYTDHEELAGPTDRSTVQAFVGYTADATRWGIQYSDQDRQSDPPLELASAYYVRQLGKERAFVGRIDRLLEPSPKGDDIDYLPFDPTARATLYLAGLEFRASRRVILTPNVVVIGYDRSESGARPATDVHLRLTFFAEFE